mgnify:CR=1 FL=1
MTTDQSSTETLRNEILADVQKECEEIILNAKRQAEIFLTGIDTETKRIKKEKLDWAYAEAARRSELILSTVPVETGRLRAARIEALLESVYDEVRKRLLAKEGFQYKDSVILLASYAINHMAGDEFVVKLSEDDYDTIGINITDEIIKRVERPVNITVLKEPDISGGGVIVEDKEARQVWDNTFLKRLERLWPIFRRHIAVQASFVPKIGAAGGNK